MMHLYKPDHLANIMVAPNGARKNKTDHPALPITITQIVQDAHACFAAGAKAMHFHVRDDAGMHVLDAGLYKEGLTELARVVPDMHLQITTEALARYSPEEMRSLVREVIPAGVSIGLYEMIEDGQIKDEDISFYRELYAEDIRVQHIIYHPEQLKILKDLLIKIDRPTDQFWCLFVIGHYSGRKSDPGQTSLFIEQLKQLHLSPDWAVCAFDHEEYATLKQAVNLGGKVRIGFENSLYLPDGKIAASNLEKVEMASKLFANL